MIAKLTAKSPVGRLDVNGQVEVTLEGTFKAGTTIPATLTQEEFVGLMVEFALEAVEPPKADKPKTTELPKFDKPEPKTDKA